MRPVLMWAKNSGRCTQGSFGQRACMGPIFHGPSIGAVRRLLGSLHARTGFGCEFVHPSPPHPPIHPPSLPLSLSPSSLTRPPTHSSVTHRPRHGTCTHCHTGNCLCLVEPCSKTRNQARSRRKSLPLLLVAPLRTVHTHVDVSVYTSTTALSTPRDRTCSFLASAIKALPEELASAMEQNGSVDARLLRTYLRTC